jgi:hypothetical protein
MEVEILFCKKENKVLVFSSLATGFDSNIVKVILKIIPIKIVNSHSKIRQEDVR